MDFFFLSALTSKNVLQTGFFVFFFFLLFFQKEDPRRKNNGDGVSWFANPNDFRPISETRNEGRERSSEGNGLLGTVGKFSRAFWQRPRGGYFGNVFYVHVFPLENV